MIVMKFGGSSVKDATAVDRVSAIIEGRLERQPVVVVSALGKTTDMLVSILDALADERPEDARKTASDIAKHHMQVLAEVVTRESERQAAGEKLDGLLARLDRLIDGMECLGEVSLRSRDSVLSLGERMSAPILAGALASRGLPAAAVDPVKIIVTDGTHEAALPLVEETTLQCRKNLGALLEQNTLPVVGGYVGATKTGVVTTLGRGGSDLTASLIAKALGADALEYWKDVDGILTADPNLVDNARPVPSLTFREAAELAFLGARVLHPASIQPAVDAGVPVRVLNSYKPDSPGTLITKQDDRELAVPGSPERAISSVAYKRRQILVNLYSTRMLGASGFLRTVFEVFDRLAISVDHIATSEVNVTVTLGPTDKIEALRAALAEVAQVDVESAVGVISLVGAKLRSTPGVSERIFDALKEINIKLITYGGSGMNMSLVVEDVHVNAAVRALHKNLCEAQDA